MKIIKITYELIKYHCISYFKSSKFVMPLVVWMVIIFFLYTMKPVGVAESFAISCMFLYLIMIWVGLSYNDLEDKVTEQLMVMRTKSDTLYYVSDMLFLFIVGITGGLLGILYPIVQNLLNSGSLFSRAVNVTDICCGIIILIGSSFAGTATGSFLHPRIVKNRIQAVALTALIAVLSVVKFTIVKSFPVTAVVFWIFPPVTEMVSKLSGNEFFIIADVFAVFLTWMVYGLAFYVIKICLLKKNKF